MPNKEESSKISPIWMTRMDYLSKAAGFGVLALFSFFAFDSPDSTRSAFPWLIFIAAWSIPLFFCYRLVKTFANKSEPDAVKAVDDSEKIGQ